MFKYTIFSLVEIGMVANIQFFYITRVYNTFIVTQSLYNRKIKYRMVHGLLLDIYDRDGLKYILLVPSDLQHNYDHW